MKIFASLIVALALLPPAAAAQTPAPDTQKNDAVKPAPYTPDFAIPPGDPAVTPADQEPFNPASYVIGPQPMTLQFWPGAVVMMLIATLTASLVTNSGRSAWFVGVLVLMVYLIFAMTLYLLPPRLQ